MNAASLLSDIQALGVHLEANAGSLRYRAPRNAITAELLATLKTHKADLLAALSEQGGAIADIADSAGDGSKLLETLSSACRALPITSTEVRDALAPEHRLVRSREVLVDEPRGLKLDSPNLTQQLGRPGLRRGA